MQSSTVGVLAMLVAAAPLMAAEHEVTASAVDDAFVPSELTIQAGDTVRWSNQGEHPHNVHADDGSFRCAKGCDSMAASGPEAYHGPDPPPENSPGDPSADNWSFALTFNEPGEIPFHCQTHGAPGGIGMSGTITVLPAGDPEPEFAINFGLTGSWFNPATSGQGFLFDIVLAQEPPQVVVYWFTYDTGEPGGPAAQRWLVAQGNYQDPTDTVLLDVLQVTGGVFDRPDPVDAQIIGVAELKFENCTTATLTYDMNFGGGTISDTIPIERLSPDVLCAELANQE